MSDTAAKVVSGLGPPAPKHTGPKEAKPSGFDAHNVLQLDERTYSRALDCVHCGLCLPACPTYTQNGLEGDSPRGRIYLMKGMADGRVEPTDAVLEHLDLCLDCRACETACPSGVVYHELIEETRERLATLRKPTVVDRMVEFMFFRVFPYPSRLKLAMIPPRLLQKIGLWKPLVSVTNAILPTQLNKMQQMLPSSGPMWESSLAEVYLADDAAKIDGKPKARVGLLAGCVGSVLFQDVNRQTIALLQKAGCDVVVPKAQNCCGAIHHHGGHVDQARAFARGNIDVFETEQVKFIVNNAAGCGAMLKDYAHLLRDDQDYAEKSVAFTAKNRDICELLHEVGLPDNPKKIERTVTYHDACHLAHAQRITAQPRDLLARIPGLTVIPLFESDMCCGAAGTYNLSQPDMARELAERKLGHIRKTGATTCVTGNVGCAMQIQSEAERTGMMLNVVHPVTILHEAYCE